MANLLKKIQIGNPLINLEMWNLYEEHEAIQTDEQLANFYNKLLDIQEVFHYCNRKMPVLEAFTYNMIAFSTGESESSLIMEMNRVIHDESINWNHGQN